MNFSSAGNTRIVGLAGLVLAAALIGWAQYSPTANSGGVQPNSHSQGSGLNGGMETDPVFLAKRQQALNADRQKSMVSDTNKLVQLARQLDAEIASNPTDRMTSEELHKVAEIEKLARSVKAKMAQSFAGGPQFQPTPPPIGNPRLQ
jgi:Spy/CpxP family protein refolding chaperone